MLAFACQNWGLVSFFAATLLALVWFGSHMVADAIYFNDRHHHDTSLQNWMTPRYAGMSYDLPKPVMLDVLGLQDGAERLVRLGDIATDRGITMHELMQQMRDAATRFCEAQK